MEFYRDYESALEKYKELSEREFNNLYIGEGFTCTNVVAGEKCHNGGEYGYTKYTPTMLVGIYSMESSCTCDFDRCRARFEGYAILTQKKYKELISESARIEAERSLY